jgi:hypothetical protein
LTLGEQLRRSAWRVRLGSGIAGVALLALLAVWMKTDDDGFLGILDSANLVFHEAGHVVYGIFGRTLGLYGGTLGQLTFPLVVCVIFWLQRHAVGLAIGVAWVGQNLFNIARYCADARAQELPLVGGGEHDWANILGRWHALDRDLAIAHKLRVVAWALLLGALAWLAWRTWRMTREAPRET